MSDMADATDHRYGADHHYGADDDRANATDHHGADHHHWTDNHHRADHDDDQTGAAYHLGRPKEACRPAPQPQ